MVYNTRETENLVYYPNMKDEENGNLPRDAEQDRLLHFLLEGSTS